MIELNECEFLDFVNSQIQNCTDNGFFDNLQQYNFILKNYENAKQLGYRQRFFYDGTSIYAQPYTDVELEMQRKLYFESGIW